MIYVKVFRISDFFPCINLVVPVEQTQGHPGWESLLCFNMIIIVRTLNNSGTRIDHPYYSQQSGYNNHTNNQNYRLQGDPGISETDIPTETKIPIAYPLVQSHPMKHGHTVNFFRYLNPLISPIFYLNGFQSLSIYIAFGRL